MNIVSKIKDKQNLFYPILILFLAVLFVFDFFIHKGRPATFDAPFHITNIAQYSLAIRSGDFPVYWLNGFANFGLPIGIVAHQIPSYLGAVLNLFLNNPTLSFNILVFLGIFFSSLFYYFFLRIYFPPLPSFLAIFMFNFAPYRILNAYIRGAEPEIFSNIFLPIILISIYKFIIKKNFSWLYVFAISVLLLSLTHPMNLLIYSFIFGPYILFCLWEKKSPVREKTKSFLAILIGGVIGIGMAAYYFLPLMLEIKYFYISFTKNQLAPNQFLGPLNFLTERWRYETAVDHITRGHIVQTGIIETALFVSGLVMLLNAILKKKKLSLVHFSVLVGLLLLFFTTSLSSFIYDHFLLLGNIQFPWRMLNGFIFIPPIIAAALLTKYKSRIFILIFVLSICFLRFPQLYGKNFKIYPDSRYYFTNLNVHSDQMNTIWADKPENYPVKTTQYQIIGGRGTVIPRKLENSRREYAVFAKTDVRMRDNTFYFPGWRVYIDGIKTQIEFQDPNSRGLITYMVPKGVHGVSLRFEDTKVRLFGKLLSLFFASVFLAAVVFRGRIKNILGRL